MVLKYISVVFWQGTHTEVRRMEVSREDPILLAGRVGCRQASCSGVGSLEGMNVEVCVV